ncbi:hypothetical protein [Amnibacterium sp.]|uniref:hypothetical protein n=1 Tax=Amnibacterium sp. TaxID=1872496 RepID=UPI0026325BA4|nr:hypothetical protein [Amnibacterium sp.]MCU1472626.1 hypothetical protein [Amnibacterium sp.]
MPIPFFGPAQTDVFIPALAWFFVATVLAVVPVVLGPLLARMRRGRVLTTVAVALAVLAVVPGVAQAVQAFSTLGGEHALVQSTMADRYGVAVTPEQTSSLIEGGKVVLPTTGSSHTVHLEEVAPGQYAPVQSGVGPLPAR